MFVVRPIQFKALAALLETQLKYGYLNKFNKTIKLKFNISKEDYGERLSRIISIAKDANIYQIENWEKLIELDYEYDILANLDELELILNLKFNIENNKVSMIQNNLFQNGW